MRWYIENLLECLLKQVRAYEPHLQNLTLLKHIIIQFEVDPRAPGFIRRDGTVQEQSFKNWLATSPIAKELDETLVRVVHTTTVERVTLSYVVDGGESFIADAGEAAIGLIFPVLLEQGFGVMQLDGYL